MSRLPEGTGWKSDPGHGYLVVPLNWGDPQVRRMARAIATASQCSWVATGNCGTVKFAMLEEDCDAPAFAAACCISQRELAALHEEHVDHIKKPWEV